MTVLFIIYGTLHQISGGYLYDRKVVECLREHGMVVDIMGLPILPYLLCPLQTFTSRVRRLFRNRNTHKKYDCIVIDELTHPSLFLQVALRSSSCPPVVILLHHLKSSERISVLRKMLARCMGKLLLKRSDVVIANSRITEESVRGILDANIPVHICRPGCDTFTGDRVGERCGETFSVGRPVRLLITGNVIPRKGHHLLIRLLAGLTDLDWELRIAGPTVDRGYKKKLALLSWDAGLQNRIHYTGALSGNDLLYEYARADIFVFPSLYEGYGISLAEALQAGLPVVAFASGGIPEVTGGNGLLVSPGDLRTFQMYVRRLISEPDYRRRVANLSHAIAQRLPKWSDTGRIFHRILQTNIGDRMDEKRYPSSVR